MSERMWRKDTCLADAWLPRTGRHLPHTQHGSWLKSASRGRYASSSAKPALTMRCCVWPLVVSTASVLYTAPAFSPEQP